MNNSPAEAARGNRLVRGCELWAERVPNALGGLRCYDTSRLWFLSHWSA